MPLRLLVVALLGCSCVGVVLESGPPAPVTPGPITPVAPLDAGDATDGGPGVEPPPPDAGCAPRACTATHCGEQPDGCGATLRCELGCPAGLWVGGTNASDTNPGSYFAPLATLQKAASLAMPGDTVRIRSGIYRETVVPARSGEPGRPITFVADADADVMVSGADPVTTPWAVYQGHIYETEVALPVTGYNDQPTTNNTLMANQVFVAGKMMVEARWPNLRDSDDLLDRLDARDGARATWAGNTTLSDPGLPNIPGGWVGGTVWVNGWFLSQTARITSHSGTQLQFAVHPDYTGEKFHKYYFLSGRLGALDVEKEWHFDGTKLYLWAPGGGAPAQVEVKRRNWAFDLSGKAHITVKGLKLFAASIITTASSANVVLDGLDARYINHSVTLPRGNLLYPHGETTGLRLLGPGSIIMNSTVAFASGHGIVLGGGTTARNNLVHDVDYEGTFASAIWPVDRTDDQKILYNTLYRAGRSSIDMLNSKRMEIAFNDLYDFGMLSLDVAALCGTFTADLTGTRIHHNWIHDSKALPEGEGIQTGLLLDTAAGPVTFDHNVMWNNAVADIYNQQAVPQRNAGASRFYNNVFATHPTRGWSYVTYVNTPADVQRNNIYRDEIILNWGMGQGDIANVLREGVNPMFLGTGAGGLKYRVAAGSPAIDTGTVITGITDAFTGAAPDIGAYEVGGIDWVPGFGRAP